jgi:hypothetical protein
LTLNPTKNGEVPRSSTSAPKEKYQLQSSLCMPKNQFGGTSLIGCDDGMGNSSSNHPPPPQQTWDINTQHMFVFVDEKKFRA